ncbi:hypothetical protein BpHYR1_000446 [Brachionus plicatilis]|uniref:Uncharacterized protein n=1 Tax=Brachionus plicatilis TaxID=10195 RepID=A0A3M7RMG1_BRAPC|nr:hypothetical protein BpHYR1_000446 [Brachionus plicatilis]
MFVVFEHVIDARVLHVDNGFHVSSDQLSFEHFDNARLSRLVQIVIGAFTLFSDAFVTLAYVHTGAVLGEKILRLEPVELGRLVQERLLEVLVVDRTGLDAQGHEHLTGVFDGRAVS